MAYMLLRHDAYLLIIAIPLLKVRYFFFRLHNYDDRRRYAAAFW